MGIGDIYRASVAIGLPSQPTSTPKTTSGDQPSPNAIPSKGPSFKDVLDRERVQLSQHAQTRIRSREIPWSGEIESRIQNGLDVARSKGSREALILVDDIAVIANVKTNTVITAIDQSKLKEKVFTNIDSTVIV